jgi:hypothetical protein
MKTIEKTFSIILIVTFLILPFTGVAAAPKVVHEADSAILLMLSSQWMINDEIAALGSIKRGLVLSPSNPNEVDILIGVYQAQLDEVNKMNLNENVQNRLLDELETKVSKLQAKAKKVEEERNRRHRRGFFSRFFRALGRSTGGLDFTSELLALGKRKSTVARDVCCDPSDTLVVPSFMRV